MGPLWAPCQHYSLALETGNGAWLWLWAESSTASGCIFHFLVVVQGVARSRTQLSDFTFTFHFHALEKEMATHSSVLAWGIPGTGSLEGCRLWGCRVGHDWSDLAAAAAAAVISPYLEMACYQLGSSAFGSGRLSVRGDLPDRSVQWCLVNGNTWS